jgi:hypothetical protein
MTEGKSILKVPNGKLLKIFLDYEDNKINKIKITGDFFIHPEETIEKLEKTLNGVEFNSLEKKIDDFFDNEDPQMFGITIDSLKKAIKMCRR